MRGIKRRLAVLLKRLRWFVFVLLLVGLCVSIGLVFLMRWFDPPLSAVMLQRLAAEGGMVMMNAYAPATVCCPSRSALLTGVHAHRTGVYGNRNNLNFLP